MFKSLSICLSLCLSASLYATSFQGIGDLPGGHVRSDVWGMSSDGKTIVGSSISSNGGEAFRWSAEEGMVPLGDLPGAPFQSGARSASGNGSIIVGQGNLAGKPRAFHYTQDNGMVELPSSATVNDHTFNYFTIATGISTDGSVIVGNANYYAPPQGGLGDQPCYWTDGQLHVLTPPGYDSAFGARVKDMSADGSTILINTGYNNGYLWSESGGFRELPSVDVTKGPIYLMSDDATVLGGHNRDLRTAFLWSEDTGFTQMELPEGWFDNHISVLNADGSVAGGQLIDEEYYASFDQQYLEAYLWDETNGIRFIEDILTGYGIDLNGWCLTNVSGISSDGTTICGSGVNPDGFDEAWVATIPEPATMLLTLSGALIAFRRKS